MFKNYPYLTRYLVSLTIVLAAFIVYSKTLAPWIDGQGPGRELGLPPTTQPSRFDPTQFFPPDAWERQQCKILRTKQGYLIFKEYQPHDDGRVDVYPVTMVVPSSAMDGMTSGDAPIILKAPEGAVLTFDRRVTIAGGFGKFQHGKLNGNIRITRNDTDLKLKDRFEVRTSNVELRREKVVARSKVEFQFGAHHGKGRDLVIELAPANPSRKKGNQNSFSQIRLNQVDELVIDNREDFTQQNVSLHPATHEQLSSRSTHGFDQARFRVTCEGPLVYTTENDTLTLNENVVAIRQDLAGDQMKCDGLRLVFVKNSKTSAAIENAATENADARSKTSRIRRMVVIGKPAVIDFKSRETFLQASTIDFDVKKSIANLSGPDLLVTQKQFEFTGRNVQYTVNQDGSLGNTVANGPGKLSQFSSTARQRKTLEFSTEFAGRLVIRPHENRKVISLITRAYVRVGEDTDLLADELHLWIWERANALVNSQSAKWERHPAKLMAKGNVQIRSPKINGATKQLIARWKAPATQSGPARTSRPRAPQKMTEVVERPLGNPSIQAQSSANKKLYFSGDWVELDLPAIAEKRPAGPAQGPVRADKASQRFEKIVIKQNVWVSDLPIEKLSAQQRSGSPRPDPKGPLILRGDEIQLKPSQHASVDPKYQVEIRNAEKLASLAAQGLVIQGNPILYDQFAGRAWVQGEGQIDLIATPRDEATATGGNQVQPVQGFGNLESKPPATRQTVSIGWNGGMVFDGRQIYFEHRVIADVSKINLTTREKTISTARAAALTLVLDRDVDLQNPNQKKKGPAPKIEKVILANAGLLDDNTAVFKSFWKSDRPLDSLSQQDDRQIEVRNQSLNQRGDLESMQIVRVPSAIAFGFTGDIQARGPGTLQVWNRGTGSSPFRSASSTNSKSELNYTQVNFDNSLRGNAKEKSLNLKGNVRSIHAPVESWQATRDPDRDRHLNDESVRMECDRLQMNQWRPQSSGKAQIEMVASGNTIVKSQLFSATGNQVRYNQNGEQVIIEGESPNYARLTHRKTIHDRPNTAVAAKFTYYLRSKTYQAEKFKSFDLIQGGGPNR